MLDDQLKVLYELIGSMKMMILLKSIFNSMENQFQIQQGFQNCLNNLTVCLY